ncbi:MAG: MerR family transcriptional regulator [Candidatus Dormibacteraceae bacterium]
MSHSELYTVGEVAAMLGVSAHTIRAWERRHGIVHPQRTASRQRRYRGEEVDLLRDVRRAVALEGLSLKVAFETVTGRQQPPESYGARLRRASATEMPAPGDQGMWRAVADTLFELVVVIDLNGRILHANTAAAKNFGVARQGLVGRTFADLVDPFDRAKAVRLYRPRPISVNDWELNLSTRSGGRLFRLQSRIARQEGATVVVLVGAEMFEVAPARPSEVPPADARSIAAPSQADTTSNVFQKLLDQLPFGVAVTTVGSEPRVVYANEKLGQTLGQFTGHFTGRKISELLPGAPIGELFRTAVGTRSVQMLKGIEGLSAPPLQRRLDLAILPLTSRGEKVASILVIVDDASIATTAEPELARIVRHMFSNAATARELAEAGLEQLQDLIPETEFAVAIAALQDWTEDVVVASSQPRGNPLTDSLREGIRRAAAARVSSDAIVAAEGQQFGLTSAALSGERRLGAVAWWRRLDRPLSLLERGAVEMTVDRLAVAAELIQTQADAARRAGSLVAIAKVAAVVGETGDRSSLEVRFLRRLTEILEADSAAIGRVDGSDFVIEASYAKGGSCAEPGDRFALAGEFVSTSIHTGEATGTATLGSANFPAPVRRSLISMKRGLAIPLKVGGKIAHVITLLRKADRPFDEGDVIIAQAVSSVALLALALAGREADVIPSRQRGPSRGKAALLGPAISPPLRRDPSKHSADAHSLVPRSKVFSTRPINPRKQR